MTSNVLRTKLVDVESWRVSNNVTTGKHSDSSSLFCTQPTPDFESIQLALLIYTTDFFITVVEFRRLSISGVYHRSEAVKPDLG